MQIPKKPVDEKEVLSNDQLAYIMLRLRKKSEDE